MTNIEPRELPFDISQFEDYLRALYQEDVQITTVHKLVQDPDEDPLKEFGYGDPLLVEIVRDGSQERLVFHTMAADSFGHERASDRARNLLLDHATFNELPRHAPSIDVGAFTSEGELVSLRDAREFFHLTQYVPGQLYANDLHRVARTGALASGDEERAAALAKYLAGIHRRKRADPPCYWRRIRNLVGHGEGIMGMMDNFPPDFPVAPVERLEQIEERCVAWRWRIKNASHRLSQVHGDFHPWNVLFEEDGDFFLLDRSRGAWGEPADDVSAMSVNYVLFALRSSGAVSGPFRRLYDRFWETYLVQTGDDEILSVIQPFYAWRALVVAHPVWYPDLALSVREALFRFIENVLERERFEPDRIDDYLAEDAR